MAIRVDAYVLLSRGWKPSFEALASEIEWRYPQIGKVRVRRGSASETQATLVVDGAPIEISHVSAAYPSEQLHPPMRTIGHDTEAIDRLAASHHAYVVITAGCPEEGLEWARAHAALVTLVAAAVAGKTESVAVFWPDSWVCLTPSQFEEQAGHVLCGQAPVGLWCAFASSNPPRVGGAEMTGIASLGLRSYLGRELELAPMPSLSGEAIDCIREAAQHLLAGNWVPVDHDSLTLKCFADPLSVRLADDGFLRSGVPAVVLVAPEAAVDAETLARKDAVERGEGGLLGRFFRRG